MSKKKREDSLEEALGETMHKEGVMEKEKIAKENERLQAEMQRLRTMASSASITSSWAEVDKPPSTPKRSTSAVPNHTPGGTRLPIGSPPEDDEVFATPPPLPPKSSCWWWTGSDGQRMSRKIHKLSSVTSKLHTVK